MKILVIEDDPTVGQFVKTSADSFRWSEGGKEYSKTDYHLVQPNEARVVFENAPGDVIAYFPETKDHVMTKMPKRVKLSAMIKSANSSEACCRPCW